MLQDTSGDLYSIMEKCAELYRRELHHPERGNAARQYLTAARPAR